MSDWIEWSGGENPVPGKMVDLMFASDNWCRGGPSENYNWTHGRGHGLDIIAYRPSDTPASAAKGEGALDRTKLDKPMDLHIALSFADEPWRFDSLRSPADTKEELYRALTTIAAAYRALQPHPSQQTPAPAAKGEAVAWQRRMRNINAAEDHPWSKWSPWKECDERQRIECQESGGLIAGFPELRTEVRPLYAQPQPSQQALASPATGWPSREALIDLIDMDDAFAANVMDENRIWLARILTDKILALFPPVIAEGGECLSTNEVAG